MTPNQDKEPEPPTGWTESATPKEYFMKAIRAGKQEHRFVQKLRVFYPNTYQEAVRECAKDKDDLHP